MNGAGVTKEQLKMLNAICGDLARQISWHGCRLDKDDWRHLLSGTAAGWRVVPKIDDGDGSFGMILLGSSSLNLSKQQAQDAITMGLAIGDDPSSQNLNARPVVWSDAVLLGLGHNPNDFKDQAA